MSTTPHPSTDTLLLFATGAPNAERGEANELSAVDESSAVETATSIHLDGCKPCRERLAVLRGFLNTVRDELLETRPECPSSDALARLPPGAEHDDRHLQQCPLCREEVRMLFEVESAARLGTEVGEVPASGLFYRPSPVVQGGDFAYQRGAGPAGWVIAEGEEKKLVVAGAKVRLRCVEKELIVEVGETAEALALALSNELLEKQLPLTVGEQRVAAGGWKRARVVTSG